MFAPCEVVYSDWCWKDQLGGLDLVNGEKVLVLWDNGKITRHKVKVTVLTVAVDDMGHSYEAPDSRAYITVRHYGSRVTLPLRDSSLLLKRA